MNRATVALVPLVVLLLPWDVRAEDAYFREARLAGAALAAQQAAGLAPPLTLEAAELPPAEIMPGAPKEGLWVAWTVSTLATKERESTPVVRFVLVPRAAGLAWRSTLDTSGVWFEPDLLLIEDEFALFQRRGPSMDEDVVSARENATRWIAKLFDHQGDVGESATEELARKGLAAGGVSARRHVRHLSLEVLGNAPLSLADVAREYPLYWIQVVRTPDQGPISVAWTPPGGRVKERKDPTEAGLAPDAPRKLAEAEEQVAVIGRRLLDAWKAQPSADKAERLSWVEKAGPEILEIYQKTGQYVPGMTRHEEAQKRFARYLAAFE